MKNEKNPKTLWIAFKIVACAVAAGASDTAVEIHSLLLASLPHLFTKENGFNRYLIWTDYIIFHVIILNRR